MEKIETFNDALLEASKQNKKLWEILLAFEAKELELSEEEIGLRTLKYLSVMKEAVKKGVNSREKSTSGMCGFNADLLRTYYTKNKSILGDTNQKVMLYALAMAEENARMGKIVACPTAGSCGIVPAVILAYSEDNNLTQEEEIQALLTAGLVGKIISNKMALAGAVMGCQGECGVASAMAAAALCEIFKATNETIFNAAALTLKNIMGLVCDPVAGLVEVPCVKRNVFLAVNAVVGAELAMSGVKSVIPLDEVVDATYQVGTMMSVQLKESSQAGLATTKTAEKISTELNKKLKMFDRD